MRRTVLVVLILGIGRLASLMAGEASVLSAETRPTTDLVTSAVAVEVLGQSPPKPGPGYALQLNRITLSAGSRMTEDGSLGGTILYIESGEIEWTTMAGLPLLTRTRRVGTGAVRTVPAALLTVGHEVILQPGDAIYTGGDVVYAARTAAGATAVILCAALQPSDPLEAPFFAKSSPPIPGAWIDPSEAR
jgi:hypothetical protein